MCASSSKLIGLVVSTCAAILLVGAVGCSKDDSLLVLALTANPPAAGLTSVDVAAGGATKSFTLSSGLPASVGFYLPSSVTGVVVITASATGGGACYRGMKSVTLGSAGVKLDVTLTLTPAASCSSPDGGAGSGAAGTGGGAGTTGAIDGGAGATGVAGTGAATDGGAGTGAATDGGAGTGAAGTGAAGTGAAGTAPPVLVWKATENIEKDPVTPSFWPTVAIDKTHGNVLVAWTKGDFTAVRRYNAATKTWGTAKILDDRGQAQDVTVAMNDTGVALVVWTQYEATPTVTLRGIWGAHSEDGGVTWSVPARIHDQTAWATVALAMDVTGNARVVWEETAANIATVWSSTYSAATGAWTAATVVKAGVNGWEHYSHMAMAPTGAGILAWNQSDANGYDSVWASTFTTAAGALSAPVLLDTFAAGDTYIPTVAISPDGAHGIVAWEQDTATAGEVWGTDWAPTTGFTTAARIITASGVGEPAVVMDKSYNTTLVWTQQFTGGKWNVVAARRPPGQAWGAPTPLETTNQAPGDTSEYAYAQVGADRAGNVQVLWRRKVSATENTFSVVARTFSANTWQPEIVLGLKAGLQAYIYPQLAVADDGRAVATWYYWDDDATNDLESYNLFVSLYQ